MSQPEVIDTIATALSESAEEPLRLIREIVDEMGPDQALTLLSETQKVEEAGGMVVARGTRRRSPGGVFFKLAKDKLPKEAKKRIFRSPHPPKDKPPAEADGTEPARAAQPAAKPPQRTRQEPAAPVRSMPEVFVRPRRRIIAAPPAPAPAAPAPAPARNVLQKPARQAERPAEPPVAYRAEPTPVRREVHGMRRPEPVPEPAPRPAPVKERVLVRVTPQSDEPAKTLDEAIERITRLLSGLREQVARAALLEAIDHFGGLPEPEPEDEPEAIEPDEPEEEPVDLEELRQSLLVTLAQDLSVTPKALATALFGEDTPHNRRKARALLTE